ncbi:unnamed protein product [[Candida] boidinii]|nr:unnamed protein product [[Candida] boidinii]
MNSCKSFGMIVFEDTVDAVEVAVIVAVVVDVAVPEEPDELVGVTVVIDKKEFESCLSWIGSTLPFNFKTGINSKAEQPLR